MCVEIIIGDETLDTVRKLTDAIGCDPVWSEGCSRSSEQDDYCLCGVDVDATAKKSGFVAEFDEWGDIVFTRRDG